MAGSKKAYQRGLGSFPMFYDRFYGLWTPPATFIFFPISPLYLLPIAKKLAPSTITSYLSATSYVPKIQGYIDPTKSFLTARPWAERGS